MLVMYALISNLVLVDLSKVYFKPFFMFFFWTCIFTMSQSFVFMPFFYVTNFCTYFFDLFNMKLYL
jgi:hypothetical protein